jgi:general secretion pathway protein G
VTITQCHRDQIGPKQIASRGQADGFLSAHADRRRIVRKSEFCRNRGFTLVELMIVISIIAILLAVAIPTYSRSIVAARERALQSDLSLLRESIWKYTLDKKKALQSLDDLKTAGYIEKIPDDPMTREPNWEVVQEDVLLSVEQDDPGITDVHSASDGTASDGTAYSSW